MVIGLHQFVHKIDIASIDRIHNVVAIIVLTSTIYWPYTLHVQVRNPIQLPPYSYIKTN